MKREQGFTLIEMMMVILVIALLASLGVMTYHRRLERMRINRVVFEMQHLLEAALAYDADYQQWPAAHDQTNCAIEAPRKQRFVTEYLPNRVVQNGDGSYFCWGAGTSSAHEEGEGNDDHPSRLFWVAIKIPTGQLALGRRVAARLTNAVVTSELNAPEVVPCLGGNCYVRAEVVQPAAVSHRVASDALMVVAIGDCPSTNDSANANKESSNCTPVFSRVGSAYRIAFHACPSGMLARVTVFPNFIHFPPDNYPGVTVKDIEAKRSADQCQILGGGADGTPPREYCDILVRATTCTAKGPNRSKYLDIAQAEQTGSIGASYIVACIPKLED